MERSGRRLQDKCVIVTGAARGIGRAICLRCLSEGATVGANFYRSAELAEDLRRKHPGRVILLPADMREESAVTSMVQRFAAETGRLDGLVNNAGVASMRFLALARDSGPLREMIATNLLGTILGSRAAISVMWRQNGGSIVNIGSVAAERPSAGQAVYAATKGGVIAFTRALAAECEARVRVNCVSPGPVDTDMLRGVLGPEVEQSGLREAMGPLASAEDAAATVAFLLSDEATSITGAHITVDAGYVLRGWPPR